MRTILTYVCKGILFLEAREGTHPNVGIEIVAEIPTDDDAFEASSPRQDWLQRKRDFFDAEEKRIEELDREYDKQAINPSKRHYDPYEAKPSEEPQFEGSYDFTYAIDLDLLEFTVRNFYAKFRLRNIPRGDDGNLWLQYLTKDVFRKFVLMPDTPKQYCVRFYGEDPELVSEKDLDLYRTFADGVKIIDESAWMSQVFGQTCPPTYTIASTITKALMMAHNHKFREECRRSPAPKLDTFYQIAEILLRTASPAGVSLSWVQYISNPGYIDCLNVCTGTFYKYRGCTILITMDCSSDECLEASIGLAVAHAQETGTDNATVIIFSVWHVAVVLISGAVSGKLEVSRSGVYPFFARFGFEEFDKAIALLSHYLRPHCVDGPVPGRKERYGPSGRINQSIPYDILVQIMRLVDFKTYDAFALVSKSLRKEWFLHPRICNYTISGAKSPDKKLYPYFPRCILHAIREEDGEPVTAYLFYKMPCVYKRVECGEFCTCHSQFCCPCPNPCGPKFCQRQVGLRMPILDKAGHQERQRMKNSVAMDFSGFYSSKEDSNYFSTTFLPGLSILYSSWSYEDCMSVEIAGREPAYVAQKCLDKRTDDN